MELISKESAYNAIKNVCDKFNVAFGGNECSGFSSDITTCLEGLFIHDTEDTKRVIKDLLAGKWVESKLVQKAFNMSFKECYSMFDFSRTADWWSVIGKTEEERKLNGQKVETFFRIRRDS